MYIYGGIGPSGQDGTMYKLDVRSWKWSQTSVTGSSDKSQNDGKSKTAVLIAAIVSSVLGVVVIGIAATVIYRVVRRRYGAFSSADRGQSDGNSTLGSDSDADGAVAMTDAKSDNGHNEGKAPYNGDSAVSYTGPYGGNDTSASDIVIHPSETPTQGPALPLHDRSAADQLDAAHVGSASDNSTAAPAGLPLSLHSRGGSAGGISPLSPTGVHIDTSNSGSAITTPTSMAGGGMALLPASRDSPSSRRQMVDSVRARARSLSHRFAASRFSAAFSDSGEESVPEVPPTRRRRTGASPPPAATRKSVASSKYTALANMYGPDQARLENEYRQAEAINEILLSGQPIPTWLRDAVNQAESEGSGHRSENADSTAAATSSSPSADLGRRFMIANDPDAK
ncbi:hypothetical protein H4R20_006712 [Coemansia guatemalensis]|uniref:Uncharacterized protein n=1 Tax=Coemansia guatemalensis TaxID=2761395 RepID=A0A9W8HN47_9FUNG|nr:hypothetical protein H4R20_006712 [Coemansia guatemalensis]